MGLILDPRGTWNINNAVACHGVVSSSIGLDGFEPSTS